MIKQVESTLQIVPADADSEQQWRRVVYVLDHTATLEWMGIQEDKRRDLESRLSTLCLAHWSEPAIDRWLIDNDILHDISGTTAVMEATGGYHYLLSHLREICLEGEGTRLDAAIQILGDRLYDNRSAFFKTVYAAADLSNDPTLKTVFADLVKLIQPGQEENYDVVIDVLTEEDRSREQLEHFIDVLDRTAHLICFRDGDRVTSLSINPIQRALLVN